MRFSQKVKIRNHTVELDRNTQNIMKKVSFSFVCNFFVQYFKNTPLCSFLKVGKSVISVFFQRNPEIHEILKYKLNGHLFQGDRFFSSICQTACYFWEIFCSTVSWFWEIFVEFCNFWILFVACHINRITYAWLQPK